MYDTSSSPEARVYRVDMDDRRLFIKTSSQGTLSAEATMTRYVHGLGLSGEVVLYETLPTPDSSSGNGVTQRDWLITGAVSGSDCTDDTYLADPERLCEMMADILHLLSEQPVHGCPVAHRTDDYLTHAWNRCSRMLSDMKEDDNPNRHDGPVDGIPHGALFDVHYYTNRFGDASVQDIAEVLRRYRHSLTTDTLIHGDFCLPNIILDHWRFSGFVDLGGSGVGDRHIDVFWALWTLQYNLKTHEHDDRFLDAYGRDRIDPDALRAVAAAEVFSRQADNDHYVRSGGSCLSAALPSRRRTTWSMPSERHFFSPTLRDAACLQICH